MKAGIEPGLGAAADSVLARGLFGRDCARIDAVGHSAGVAEDRQRMSLAGQSWQDGRRAYGPNRFSSVTRRKRLPGASFAMARGFYSGGTRWDVLQRARGARLSRICQERRAPRQQQQRPYARRRASSGLPAKTDVAPGGRDAQNGEHRGRASGAEQSQWAPINGALTQEVWVVGEGQGAARLPTRHSPESIPQPVRRRG